MLLEKPQVIHKSFAIVSTTEMSEKAVGNDLMNAQEHYIEIKGYASRMFSADGTYVIDADQENINTFGIDLKRLANGILPLLFNHNQNKAVGKVMSATYDRDGLLITGRVYKLPGDNLTNYVYEAVKSGIISSFSVGILVKDFEVITQQENDYLQLSQSEAIEISLVSVPANPEATFEVMSVKSISGADKMVTRISKSVLKPENTEVCNSLECAFTASKKIAEESAKGVELETKNIEPEVTPVEKEFVAGVTEEALDKLDAILEPSEAEVAVEVTVEVEVEVTPEPEIQPEVPEVVPVTVENTIEAMGNININSLSDDQLDSLYETLTGLVDQIDDVIVAAALEAVREGMTITTPNE